MAVEATVGIEVGLVIGGTISLELSGTGAIELGIIVVSAFSALAAAGVNIIFC
jgi:hypothetical protein